MSLTAKDLYRIGLNLLAEGNPSEALHYLRQAQEDLPPGYDLHLALGRVLTDLGDQAEAEAYYRRCIDENADRPEAYLEWAELRRRQGNKEGAQKLEAFGKARGGQRRAPAKTGEDTNWEPEATAPKEGDLAFFCPGCAHPIMHESSVGACPNCRMSLQPIRHGHIVHSWRLNNEQSFQCAQCKQLLTGRETECPSCDTNLVTGELSEAALRNSGRSRADGLKSPWAIAAMVLGFLLLCIGIGQFSVPSKRSEAGRVWTQVTQRITSGASEGVEILRDTKVHDESVAKNFNDSEMLWMFSQYFGVIFLGGLVAVLGFLKWHFDKLN